MKRTNIICWLLLLCVVSTHAQFDRLKYTTVLQTASLKINSPVLSYSYKVLMINNNGGVVSDSITGTLIKSYGSYLDSNSASVSMVNDGYFFKADRLQKTALACRIATIQQKLGLKPEDLHTNPLTLPDSFISRVADFRAEEQPDVLVITYTLKQSAQGLKQLVLRINRKDNALLGLKMTVDDLDRWGNPSGYSRIYLLQAFSNTIDPRRLKLSNYITLEPDNARLSGQFKSYTLKTFF